MKSPWISRGAPETRLQPASPLPLTNVLAVASERMKAKHGNIHNASWARAGCSTCSYTGTYKEAGLGQDSQTITFFNCTPFPLPHPQSSFLPSKVIYAKLSRHPCNNLRRGRQTRHRDVRRLQRATLANQRKRAICEKFRSNISSKL